MFTIFLVKDSFLGSNLFQHSANGVMSSHNDRNTVSNVMNRLIKTIYNCVVVSGTMIVLSVNVFVESGVAHQYNVNILKMRDRPRKAQNIIKRYWTPVQTLVAGWVSGWHLLYPNWTLT